MLFFKIPEASFISECFQMYYIRVYSSNTCLVPNYHNYMRFLAHLSFTYMSCVFWQSESVHLDELAWSHVIKVLPLSQFSILPSKAKARSDFWCGLETNQLISYNRSYSHFTRAIVKYSVKLIFIWNCLSKHTIKTTTRIYPRKIIILRSC